MIRPHDGRDIGLVVRAWGRPLKTVRHNQTSEAEVAAETRPKQDLDKAKKKGDLR